MDRDASIREALASLRDVFPAMRVRTEHIQLDERLTIFRATITLPSGGEATGYGSVEGLSVAAVTEAENRALTRALVLMGLDDEFVLALADDGTSSPVYGRGDADAAGPEAGVAESGDPLNLGPTPSAADVAAATGMQLGVRREAAAPIPSARPSAEPPAFESRLPERRVPEARTPEARTPEPRAPEPAPERVPDHEPAAPAPDDEAGTDELLEERSQRRDVPTATRGALRRPMTPSARQRESDAAVSQASFWAWASDRGLGSRELVEEYIGQPIKGMRPSAVMNRILEVEAERGDGPPDDLDDDQR